MKELILLLITCTRIYSLPAQHYDLPSKDLNAKFVEIYSQTDKNKNLFQRLSETNDFFFSEFNEPVVNALTGLQKKYKLSGDAAGNIIFDTVMQSFTHDHLWDEYTGDKEKYLPFLELYNGKLCPCIGEKIQQSAFHRLEAKDVSDCVQGLVTDTSYINGTRRTMGSSTVNEVYSAAQMGLPYMYRHCAALYDFYSTIMRHSVYELVGELNRSINGRDQTVLQLYRNQSPELAKTFPGYKKYETDLKSANGFFKQKGALYMWDTTKDASGHLTIVKTYYGHTNEKLVLLGQIVFTLKDELAGSEVLFFKFTPAAKMKDRAKYLARINDEEMIEPPPMEEKRIDIKIDTLQRKN